jgi:hypothetical protein
MMAAMTGLPALSWQGSLFDSMSADPLGFDALVHHRLDADTWLNLLVMDSGQQYFPGLWRSSWR